LSDGVEMLIDPTTVEKRAKIRILLILLEEFKKIF